MSAKILKVAYGSENLPLQIDGVSLQCFILEDQQRVIVKSSFLKAFGYDSRQEHGLLELLHAIDKFYPIPAEVFSAIEQPVLFEINRDSPRIEGIPGAFLPAVCLIITTAKEAGYLSMAQMKFARNAEFILARLNKSNIIDLIDNTTGFIFFKTQAKWHLRQFFEENLNDDAFRWISTFPDSFFDAFFKTYSLDWRNLRESPQTAAKILYDIIFTRISDEVLLTLREKAPKRVYKKKNQLQQEQLQHPLLKEYLIILIQLFEMSGYNPNVFIQLLHRTNPKNSRFLTRFPFYAGISSKKNEPLSAFNTILKKMS